MTSTSRPKVFIPVGVGTCIVMSSMRGSCVASRVIIVPVGVASIATASASVSVSIRHCSVVEQVCSAVEYLMMK